MKNILIKIILNEIQNRLCSIQDHEKKRMARIRCMHTIRV